WRISSPTTSGPPANAGSQVETSPRRRTSRPLTPTPAPRCRIGLDVLPDVYAQPGGPTSPTNRPRALDGEDPREPGPRPEQALRALRTDADHVHGDADDRTQPIDVAHGRG